MQLGNGTFLHGDCLELMRELPSGSVDMICTDPPFGMDYQSNRRIVGEQHAKIAGDKDLGWLPEFVDESYRVAADNTAHYFFCSFHKIDVFKQELERHFKVKNLLVWDKNNHGTGDLKGDFAPKVEFCWFVHKGRALLRGKREPNIFRFARTANELHPTQKPVDLMYYLIEKFSDPSHLILDPFAGSGTTAIAAENAGRKWICMERDPTYYETAVGRVWDHVS
jgi:site-specific DNA-methyltransferase (adenine-specific)